MIRYGETNKGFNHTLIFILLILTYFTKAKKLRISTDTLLTHYLTLAYKIFILS